MRIQHNIMAMSAYRNYTNNVAAMKKNLEKLSSGYKINRAGDDAAGLAISEKMRAQITGLETAQKNAKDGISLVQTAEGALTEVHSMLNRMVELATQSANGTYDDGQDRVQLQKEVDQLLSEINRIADSSNFNGIKLLDGTLGLNTDTFTKITAGDTYTAPTSAVTSDLTVSATHGGESVTASKPTFVVDLKALALSQASGTAGNVDTIKISIASVGTVTATKAGVTSAATADATAIAALFANKYTGSGSSKSLKVGDAYFKATSNGGKITFSLSGYVTEKGTFAGASAASNATKFMDTLDDAKVKAINDKLNAAKVSVSVSGGKGSLNSTDAIDHGVQYTAAIAKKDGGLLGGEIELTEDLLATGAKLSIDGKDFTFTVTTGADATSDYNSGNIKINGELYTTASARLAEAKRLLTQGSTTNFDINTAAGNKISIDQKSTASGTPTNTESYKSMADVTITKTVPGQSEKIASTKLYVSGTAKEGNVLNIGTDKITFDGGEDIDAIKTAIEAKGYTVTKGTDTDGTYLNIQGKAATGVANKDITAPQILGKGLTLQIGDTSDDFNQLNVAVQDMHAASLGIEGLKINTEEAAQKAIQKIKDAINTVSDVRGTLGATQNRLDHTINNLSVMTENIQDAESTIRDVDVAEEMMAYTKNNILIQSAQAMLAQANQVPQGVLQLLQ